LEHKVRADHDQELADPDGLDIDDSALLALAAAGDQQAVAALCRRHWWPVYRSFARYTSDQFEAEDLTQEVFLRAVRALPSFADTGVPYSAYLLTIATNLARDRWRARPWRVVPVRDVPERPAAGPGPDGLAVQSARRAALVRALDKLRPDQRTVLRLRILEGRTVGEVAALTNRSAAAVRQSQVRALSALRAALDELGDITADSGSD
jgi:RNA polymerase sigma-70 factor, ECF subfamily